MALGAPLVLGEAPAATSAGRCELGQLPVWHGLCHWHLCSLLEGALCPQAPWGSQPRSPPPSLPRELCSLAAAGEREEFPFVYTRISSGSWKHLMGDVVIKGEASRNRVWLSRKSSGRSILIITDLLQLEPSTPRCFCCKLRAGEEGTGSNAQPGRG